MHKAKLQHYPPPPPPLPNPFGPKMSQFHAGFGIFGDIVCLLPFAEYWIRHCVVNMAYVQGNLRKAMFKAKEFLQEIMLVSFNWFIILIYKSKWFIILSYTAIT